MMLFDTHTHLYLTEFDADRAEVMSRAKDAGVGMMMFPNVDCGTIAPMKRLHEEYPDTTLMAMGLHPTEVNGSWKEALDIVMSELANGSYAAVGEIGIDLYWDKTYRKEQMEVFAIQVDKAIEMDLPIIIHCREGLDKVLEVLGNVNGKVKGVFHSFGGSIDDVERIRRIGDFYFGINGIVTFKNSKLREVLPTIGAERILLETDAPYLAPVPYRGKRNETAYMTETAKAVAAALSIDVDTISDITTENARNLFLSRE